MFKLVFAKAQIIFYLHVCCCLTAQRSNYKDDFQNSYNYSNVAINFTNKLTNSRELEILETGSLGNKQKDGHRGIPRMTFATLILQYIQIKKKIIEVS